MATDSSSESKTPSGAEIAPRPANGAPAAAKAAQSAPAKTKPTAAKAASGNSAPPASETPKAVSAAKLAGGAPASRASAAELRATVAKKSTPSDTQPKSGAGPQGDAGRKPDAGKKKGPSSHGTTLADFEELEQCGNLSFMQVMPAWLISIVVHMVVLLIFGLWKMMPPKKDDVNVMSANAVTKLDDLEDVQDLDDSPPLDVDTALTEVVSTVETITDSESVDPTDVVDTPAPPASVELSDFGIPTAPKTDLLSTIGTYSGKGLDGRGDAMRQQLAASRGATSGSESAVGKALKWLADHQYPDGGWSFDHRGAGKCSNRCSAPGTLKNARFAATGMALMPFLGQGQTHKQGKYKEVVRGGLMYLCKNMKFTAEHGGDMSFDGGAMYGHGISSIALCEAYAMTQDRSLMQPAQDALNFIMYAQDPVGGGWRYQPRTPGDTSVVGWQIMALKSGFLGYMQVHPATIKGAQKFLDSVQTDDGAAYGYDRPGSGAATNAIGLLCRMYMGWQHEDPRLERGVKGLVAIGPQPGNMYFNYYATQVLCQYEGPLWEDQWNPKMRDMLVESQSSSEGHEKGSWSFKGDPGSEPGGRLYSTAMAAMTLEVYYRYMPLYTKKSAEDDFAD